MHGLAVGRLSRYPCNMHSRLHCVEIPFILRGIVQVPMNQLFRHDFFVQKWGDQDQIQHWQISVGQQWCIFMRRIKLPKIEFCWTMMIRMPCHIAQVDATEKVIRVPWMSHLNRFSSFTDQSIMLDVIDRLQEQFRNKCTQEESGHSIEAAKSKCQDCNHQASLKSNQHSFV